MFRSKVKNKLFFGPQRSVMRIRLRDIGPFVELLVERIDIHSVFPVTQVVAAEGEGFKGAGQRLQSGPNCCVHAKSHRSSPKATHPE